jgi:hypothetical protein
LLLICVSRGLFFWIWQLGHAYPSEAPGQTGLTLFCRISCCSCFYFIPTGLIRYQSWLVLVPDWHCGIRMTNCSIRKVDRLWDQSDSLVVIQIDWLWCLSDFWKVYNHSDSTISQSDVSHSDIRTSHTDATISQPVNSDTTIGHSNTTTSHSDTATNQSSNTTSHSDTTISQSSNTTSHSDTTTSQTWYHNQSLRYRSVKKPM